MQIVSDISSVRRIIDGYRQNRQRLAFVPTMGALHEGHAACIRMAAEEADVVISSIFVNPTQFGPREDLAKYPVSPEKDLALCDSAGCDIVFTPVLDAMYPSPQEVWVEPGPLAAPLCGASRAGHFRGVCTVVCKLFNIVRPDVAVFGQKDAQQAVVLKNMVAQLNLPVKLRVCSTVREEDGLALSSRNAYLSVDERKRAPHLRLGLQVGLVQAQRGELGCDKLKTVVLDYLGANGIDAIEYVEFVNASTLQAAERIESTTLLAAAVRVGITRLIDNIVLEPGGEDGVREVLLF